MPEGTPKRGQARTTPGRHSGEVQLGLGRRVYDNQTVRTDSQGAGDVSAEVVNSRFDRIEDRLASLEQMLRELIGSRAEPQPDDGRPAAPTETAAAFVPAAESVPESPVQSPEPASDDEELDPSVREYVERLLQRDEANRATRLSGPPPAPPSRLTGTPQLTANDERLAMEPGPSLSRPQPLARPADELEAFPDTASLPLSLAPRRPRADHDVNLEAMRAVANLSASAAIRSYEKTQAARKTLDRLPLLLIGAVCGLMLLYTAFSSGAAGMLVGAGVAFLGAALTAWQLLFIFFRWLAASRPVREP